MVGDDFTVGSCVDIRKWNNGDNFLCDSFRVLMSLNCQALLFSPELINSLIGAKLRLLTHACITSFVNGTCVPSDETTRKSIGGVGGGLLKFISPSNKRRWTKFPASMPPLGENDLNTINLGVLCSLPPTSLICRDKLIPFVILWASTTDMNNMPSGSEMTSVWSIIEKKRINCLIDRRLSFSSHYLLIIQFFTVFLAVDVEDLMIDQYRRRSFDQLRCCILFIEIEYSFG